MTVSYNLAVSSIKSWTFLRLIFRWKGSIWKAVISEVACWIVFYYIVMVIYRCGLSKESQKTFALFAQQVDSNLDWIPLTFILGFFVSIVIDRWKYLFANIGFIDNTALFLSTYLPGEDAETLTVRRQLVRYMCLSQALVLRDVSVPVRKRFPSLDCVINAGFLNLEEKLLIEAIPNQYSKYWLPISWAFAILSEQRNAGKITCDLFLNVMLNEIKAFRENLQMVVNYDWVPVPLAYSQTVVLAVRIYFMICVFSRQHIIDPDHVIGSNSLHLIDFYVPFLTICQLVIYLGWLSVSTQLLNPFGEDDDDLETNFVLDRNLSIALSIVDHCHKKHPILRADSFRKTNEKPHDAPPTLSPALVGSASQLLVDESTGRKQSLGTAAAHHLQEIRRRMSRAMSITSISPEQHSKSQEAWHQRPIHCSEPRDLPTIRSIDDLIRKR
ncbi:Bestrophin-like protein [Aphelenchoides fujianensis]|nr:Bestrophin-like protein [Aphelenchoides fujianensis]